MIAWSGEDGRGIWGTYSLIFIGMNQFFKKKLFISLVGVIMLWWLTFLWLLIYETKNQCTFVVLNNFPFISCWKPDFSDYVWKPLILLYPKKRYPSTSKSHLCSWIFSRVSKVWFWLVCPCSSRWDTPRPEIRSRYLWTFLGMKSWKSWYIWYVKVICCKGKWGERISVSEAQRNVTRNKRI